MKHQLNALERLTLLSILPAEGNFLTLKLVRELREMLSFSELENKRLSFVQDGDQVRWDESGDILKDCDIGEKMTDLIVETLEELNKKEQLKLQMFSLYEKFVIQEA
jgi:hypothetical protein